MTSTVASLPLVEYYRPKTRGDLIGNKKAVDAVYSFIESWQPGKSPRALLLVGPPGTGKTSAIFAAANDLNLDVVEFNSSDNRRKGDIEELVAPITQFSSLSFDGSSVKGRLILIDEVDGMHGNYDRGGVTALVKLIKNSRYPIIMTANNIESNQVQSLSKVASLVEFRRPDEFDILELLERIVENERKRSDAIAVSDDQLQMIAESSAGDIRAAINELEAFFHSDGERYSPPSRDRAKVMVDILNEVYSAKTLEQATKALNRTTSEYFLLLNYMYDLTQYECRDPEELYMAYRQIANADLTLQRILRSQNYSLLRYFFNFLSAGIFYSRKPRNRKIIRELTSLPQSLYARGRYKMANKAALALAPSLAPKLHIPKRKFVHEEFFYLTKILRGRDGAYVAASLDMSDEEIALVLKINRDRTLMDYIEEARNEIGKERKEVGYHVVEELPGESIEDFIQQALFEFSLAELDSIGKANKKKKKRRTVRKKKTTKKEGSAVKKEDQPGTKPQTDDKVDENDKQTTIDDFFG